MRKVIQLAPGEAYTLFALCDDGTMWYWESRNKLTKWIRVFDVPQEDDE